MLWIAALCGGVFGLLGGFMVDRLGRKTVMVGSILVYSFSPVAAAYSTELWLLVLFRCTTFIGVCVEMVAAVTWLAELFEDKRTRELAIGWTLACASLGGIFVTEVYNVIVARRAGAPRRAVVAPGRHDPRRAWRYTLLTGLVPGALILLLMPFVPESRVWKERKRGRHAQPAALRRAVLPRTAPHHARDDAALGVRLRGRVRRAAARRRSQIGPGPAGPIAEAGSTARAGEGRRPGRSCKGTKADDAGGEGRGARRKLADGQEAARRRRSSPKRGNIQRWQELGGLTGPHPLRRPAHLRRRAGC